MSRISLDVDLELHAPGLDLDPYRWNLHQMFCRELHAHIGAFAAAAAEGHEAHGRGTIVVDGAAWRALVVEGASPSSDGWSFRYVPAGDVGWAGEFGLGAAGYRAALDGYDPASTFVLTVWQRGGEIRSCYVVRTSPPPPAADPADSDPP